MKKMLSTALLGVALAVGSANAQIYVRIGPPPPRKEVLVVRPGPEYVWVKGYHRWDGNQYVWVPGSWVVPPRPHARWVDGRWVHRRQGWIWVEGRWR
jgi:hypothetical protein